MKEIVCTKIYHSNSTFFLIFYFLASTGDLDLHVVIYRKCAIASNKRNQKNIVSEFRSESSAASASTLCVCDQRVL